MSKTSYSLHIKREELVKNAMLQMIPVGRFAAPAEVAQLVAFLAGETTGYITGQVFAIDGGLRM